MTSLQNNHDPSARLQVRAEKRESTDGWEAGGLHSTSSFCKGLASQGCWPLLHEPGECDGETRTGHHKENLATEVRPFSSLGVSSEPDTAGDQGEGRAPGPSTRDRCTDTPNSEPGLWASGRASKQAPRQHTPCAFPQIHLLLPSRRERSRREAWRPAPSLPCLKGKGWGRRADRECGAGLGARAGSGRDALLAGEAGEDRIPVQSGPGGS